MIPDEEERWDDLEIEDNSFMYRATRGIYSCYKDKEVALLCQRVLSPSYSEDDDTISTVTSRHSDKFSVDEHDYYLNDINNLMASSPSLSTKHYKSKTTVPITKNQLQLQHLYSPSPSIISTPSETDLFSELLKDYDGPGKVTRLGQPYGGRVQMDYGDWTHDIEIPNNEPFQKKKSKQSTILKNNNDNNNKNSDGDNTLLLFNNDILDNDSFTDDLLLTNDNNNNNTLKQKRVHFGDDYDLGNNNKNNNINSKINNLLNPFLNNQEQKSSLITHQQWMAESDDEGFDDISLPDYMDNLYFKNYLTNNKTKSTTCISNNSIINNSSRKEKPHQLPIHLEKIQCYKENDHDDFIDGLDLIDEEAFKFGNFNKKTKQQQQTESKLPKLKKNPQKLYPSPSSSVSPPSLSSTISQNKRSVYENKLQRLTAPTYSSRQRTITSNNSFLSLSSSPSPSSNIMNNNNSNNHTSLVRTRKSDINSRKEPSSSSTINHRYHVSNRPLTKNDLSTPTPTLRSNLLQQQQQQQQRKSKHTLTRKKPFPSDYDTTATANEFSPTLMTRPKSFRYANYGNGTELDDLDDLAIWKKSNLSSYNRTPTNLHKKQDPSKPWRQYMSKRNLKLIKPDGQVLAPEINGMKYDSKNKQWKGNEQAVKSFEAATKRRPALIKNMTSSKLSNKYSNAVSVGEMVFDQEEMKWNAINGSEIDIFSHINDLLDNTIHETSIIHSTSTFDRRRPSIIPMSSTFPSSPLPTPSIHKQSTINHNTNNNSNDISNQHRSQVTNYYNSTNYQHTNVPIFYIPDEMKTHMRDLEAEHKKQFSTWPIYEECETTKNQFGHITPQYAYILY